MKIVLFELLLPFLLALIIECQGKLVCIYTCHYDIAFN